jgi:hypothetical protein
MDAKKWVEIHQAIDWISANIIKGLMESQGLTVSLSQEGYHQAMGIYGYPYGTVSILVPDDQTQAAQQVLDDYFNGVFETDSDH